jgi:hypothetical protein
MSIPRRTPTPKKIDHTYIACLECRFKGNWQADSTGHYIAEGDDAEVRLVRLDRTRQYLGFKTGANVTLLPSNVLTYEEADVEEDVDIDEDTRGH